MVVSQIFQTEWKQPTTAYGLHFLHKPVSCPPTTAAGWLGLKERYLQWPSRGWIGWPQLGGLEQRRSVSRMKGHVEHLHRVKPIHREQCSIQEVAGVISWGGMSYWAWTRWQSLSLWVRECWDRTVSWSSWKLSLADEPSVYFGFLHRQEFLQSSWTPF